MRRAVAAQCWRATTLGLCLLQAACAAPGTPVAISPRVQVEATLHPPSVKPAPARRPAVSARVEAPARVVTASKPVVQAPASSAPAVVDAPALSDGVSSIPGAAPMLPVPASSPMLERSAVTFAYPNARSIAASPSGRAVMSAVALDPSSTGAIVPSVAEAPNCDPASVACGMDLRPTLKPGEAAH